MIASSLFDNFENNLPLELTYTAKDNQMSASDLGEAIIGMSTMMRITGISAGLEFEDVFIYTVEPGSVKTLFVLVKRTRSGKKELTNLGGTVIGGLIILTLQLIAEQGITLLKNPDSEILKTAEKRVLELCMNSLYRDSVGKIAKPLNEENEKVIVKSGDVSCEITRQSKYKFIDEGKELILPELRDGETYRLAGTLTRMNMKNNDLGFEYHGRTLSIFPADPEKHVANEFYQFLPTPEVIVTGAVVRRSYYEVPKIKVQVMEQFKVEQKMLFGDITEK